MGMDPKCFKEGTVEHHKALPYLETDNSLSYWMIGGRMIKIDGVPAVKNIEAILDTARGVIRGPHDLVQMFYLRLKGLCLNIRIKASGERFRYFFNCEQARAMKFKITFSWGIGDWELTVDQ